MNAGGHGRETREVLRSARVVDLLGDGLGVDRSVDDLALGYRRSAIGSSDVVVGATFSVTADDPAACEARIAEIVRWRREHQPGGANAGSVFRNPPGESAGAADRALRPEGPADRRRRRSRRSTRTSSRPSRARPRPTSATSCARCSVGCRPRPGSSSSPSCTSSGSPTTRRKGSRERRRHPAAAARALGPRPSPGLTAHRQPSVRAPARPRPSTVMTQPPADAARGASSREPAAVRAEAAVRRAAEASRPPSRPDAALCGARRPSRRPDASPPARDRWTGPPPDRAAGLGDPQAGVDTGEISLAALREAAALAARAPTRRRSSRRPRRRRAAGGRGPRCRGCSSLERASTARATGAAGDRSPHPRAPGRGHPRRGPRRLRILLTVVAIASFIGIAWLIVQSPLLAVKTIKVEGSAQETPGGGADRPRASRPAPRCCSSTPARSRAGSRSCRGSRRRRWTASCPNDLKITVVERSPVAWARRPVPAAHPKGTLGAIVARRPLRPGARRRRRCRRPGCPSSSAWSGSPSEGRQHRAGRARGRAWRMLPDALRAQTGSVDPAQGPGRAPADPAVPDGPSPRRGRSGSATSRTSRRRAQPRSRCSTASPSTASTSTTSTFGCPERPQPVIECPIVRSVRVSTTTTG